MSKCIMKTLTPAARVRLLPFREDYEIDNVIYAPLLHKKIMALATIDSVATTKTLRSNLRELPTGKGYSVLLANCPAICSVIFVTSCHFCMGQNVLAI